MKVVGYARVSTEKQAKEGISLEAQEAKIKAWAELNDSELIGMFQDAGISGAKENREGLNKALELAISERTALVVYSLRNENEITSHFESRFILPDYVAKRQGYSSMPTFSHLVRQATRLSKTQEFI